MSIMAEIIKVKNQHYSAYCDEKVETAVLEGRHGVMVTIAEKSGSSQRVGKKCSSKHWHPDALQAALLAATLK